MKDQEEIQNVTCPNCNYYTTTEELDWKIKESGEIEYCKCPECGYEFDVK
jgi:transcription elongation factor Elf1